MHLRLTPLGLELLEDRLMPFHVNGHELLASVSQNVTGLIVEGQRVWWGEGDSIRGVLKDDQSTVRRLGAAGVRDLVYSNNFLYYVDGDSVWQLNGDTGARVRLTNEFGHPDNGLGGHPTYLAVGSGAQPDLYVTTGSTLDRAIYRVNRSTPGPPTRVEVSFLAEDVTAGNVGAAWVAPSRGRVENIRSQLLIGSPELVYDAASSGEPTGGSGPQTILSDYPGNLFWVEGNGVVRQYRGGSILNLAFGTGGAHGSGLAVDNGGDGFVYFVNGNSIQYVPKDGDPSQVLTLISGVSPVYLAIDGQHVYWSTPTTIERFPKPQTSYLFPPPALEPSPSINGFSAFGTDVGAEPRIRVIENGLEIQNFLAFDSGFRGGVRVAVGDVNGDGTPDIIAAPGPGGPSVVRVFDGRTAKLLGEFSVLDGTFTGGLFVSAGDFDGDGKSELVVSPDEGGGPRVQILSFATGAVAVNYFGIVDPNFRGGARTAVGDVNGDGTPDLIVAAGFGGGPRVSVWDGKSLLTGNPQTLVNDFFVFEQSLRNGVYIAAGDLDADGNADIIAGGGPGGGPRVLAISGKDLIQSGGGTQTALLNYFAGDPAVRGGARVTAADLDGDGKADVLAAPGPGGAPQVTITSGATRNLIDNFLAFPSGTGAFVAVRP